MTVPQCDTRVAFDQKGITGPGENVCFSVSGTLSFMTLSAKLIEGCIMT